ncbi:hypothetical protein [Pseudomonas aeruginosa]|uniref:hypothetical protein n=1 Tax=Pseudomonas aeruginosa TaxID=287 RepID=UPI00155ADE9E|nr:hypothetical protein [Pseudomonas aeruginosa]MBX6793197.1 hypothetical protein [Pseudomonas aeruginosa]HBO5046957.1 hypothetical protein [Pseudomonas aeruginosa]
MTITIDLTKAAQVLIFGGFFCGQRVHVRRGVCGGGMAMKLTTTAYYNEIDPYAAQWLRNLIAAGPIWGGIITAEATHLSAAGGGRHEENTRSSGF